MGQEEERKDFPLLSLLQKREFRNGEYEIKMPIRKAPKVHQHHTSLQLGMGGGKYSGVIFRNST